MATVGSPAFARELGRTLSLLAKAGRARRIYQPGNAALVRLLRDLTAGLEAALEKVEVIDLRVRANGLFFEGACVLDSPNPEESLAFALYRDGIRRLAFYRGLRPEEVEVLVAAAASGVTSTGLGEDIVTYLWRHDLEHIQYLVVDTTIVDANAGSSPTSSSQDIPAPTDIDFAIDALLRNIYGEARDDVGITSMSLDLSDISAKQIAESLDTIDDMAPGFHPQRSFTMTPAYAREVLAELEREDEHRVAVRAGHAVLHSLRTQVAGSPEQLRLFEVLLQMYDAAIIEGNLRLASFLLFGVSRCPSTQERDAWLGEAVAETRLRQVAQNTAATAEPDLDSLIVFLRTCGRCAVGTILGMLPSLPEPSGRRALTDLVLELGVDDLDRIRSLLGSEQVFVAQEALYLLDRLGSPEAQALLLEAAHHPSSQVRIALLELAPGIDEDMGFQAAARGLEDADPKVRIAAARALSRIPGRAVAARLEERIQSPAFEVETSEVKLALLVSYALTSQSRALPVLSRLVKSGEGLLAGRRAQDTAIQALKALRGVRGSPRILRIFERAARARRRRVREAARALLSEMEAGR